MNDVDYGRQVVLPGTDKIAKRFSVEAFMGCPSRFKFEISASDRWQPIFCYALRQSLDAASQ